MFFNLLYDFCFVSGVNIGWYVHGWRVLFHFCFIHCYNNYAETAAGQLFLFCWYLLQLYWVVGMFNTIFCCFFFLLPLFCFFYSFPKYFRMLSCSIVSYCYITYPIPFDMWPILCTVTHTYIYIYKFFFGLLFDIHNIKRNWMNTCTKCDCIYSKDVAVLQNKVFMVKMFWLLSWALSITVGLLEALFKLFHI